MKKVKVSPETAEWLEDIFKDVPLTSELDLEEMAKASRDLDNDPKYVADYLKGHFVNDIYNAMHEQGINANQLAKKWGKSRQYLSKILNEDARVNFTIDSMVELMMQLDRRVELHFPHKNEHTVVIRSQREPVKPFWKTPPAISYAGSVTHFTEFAEHCNEPKLKLNPEISFYGKYSAA